MARGYYQGGFDYFDLAGDVYGDGFDCFLGVLLLQNGLPLRYFRLPVCYFPGEAPSACSHQRVCCLQGVAACCFVQHLPVLAGLPAAGFD